ncbi:MAG TPA: hypothetical protein VK550_16145 [Polyangiaceae bacterium]|nr:hypothetical protein [Polyangiaceae bacterium]
MGKPIRPSLPSKERGKKDPRERLLRKVAQNDKEKEADARLEANLAILRSIIRKMDGKDGQVRQGKAKPADKRVSVRDAVAARFR